MTTTVQTTTNIQESKGLRVWLWVAQVLLAIAFGLAGAMKLSMPPAQIVKLAEGIPLPLLRFIGITEVAGALGMLLPAATRIVPVLTAWAAVGLATIMVLAAALHLSRGQFSHLPPVLVLLTLAAFVAWGRFTKGAISPRTR